MKVLFVHGFGGEDGGRMEGALCASFEASEHMFVPFRWSAGDLRTMTLQTGGRVLVEALTEVHPLRAAARALHAASQGVSTHWESALANITSAHVALRGMLTELAEAKEPFSLIAFSLGVRVAILTLHTMKKTPLALRRVVFAGAAVPGSAFDMIPYDLRAAKPARVINVYSDGDLILQSLYALVQNGGRDLAGIKAVKSQGVRNIKADTGHLTYARLARQLCDLAIEE